LPTPANTSKEVASIADNTGRSSGDDGTPSFRGENTFAIGLSSFSSLLGEDDIITLVVPVSLVALAEILDAAVAVAVAGAGTVEDIGKAPVVC